MAVPWSDDAVDAPWSSAAAVDSYAAEVNRYVMSGRVAAEAAEAGYGLDWVGNENSQSSPQPRPVASSAPHECERGPFSLENYVEENHFSVGTRPTAVPWNQQILQQQPEVMFKQRQQHLLPAQHQQHLHLPQQQQLWHLHPPQQQEHLHLSHQQHAPQHHQHPPQQQQHRPHAVAPGAPAVGANIGALGIEKKPSAMHCGISFSDLVALLLRHVPQEKGQQVEASFQKFKINEIKTEDFVRECRVTVGDILFLQAVQQLQRYARHAATNVKVEPQTPLSQGSREPLPLQHQTIQNSRAELPGSSQLQNPGSQKLETVENESSIQFCQQSGTGPFTVATCRPLTAPVISGCTQQPPSIGPKALPLQPPSSQCLQLQEEEERLLAGPSEQGCITEATQKAAQDEDDMLFLDEGFLRKKLHDKAEAKGFRSVGADMEKWLSKATEEFMRKMLHNIIKLAKQRCDSEDRHRIVVTADVRRDVLLQRKKEKDALEKKHDEENTRSRKMAEGQDKVTLVDVEKDEQRAKAQKQEEEEKMRAKAANIAARRAIGADDMLSKWTMLAEQGRQKRKGGVTTDGPDGAKKPKRTRERGHTGQEAAPGRPQHIAGVSKHRTTSDRPSGPGPGSASAIGRSYRITMKDVLAAMERDPRLGKSTLLYELYSTQGKPIF